MQNALRYQKLCFNAGFDGILTDLLEKQRIHPYLLLVQTPDANLSISMRHLNGVYTLRYKKDAIVMVRF